ncbi:hypothetical protein CHUAL_003196 [Chamberlinius hualienensis]
MPGDGTYHFKILVPSVAAGAIIGKGGETIAQLQKETGARVKMSKANDFYPGTTERVCLITGTAEAIIMVHSFVMEKIREKPDPNAKPAIDFDSKQPAEREKQSKILVPNSTAGMIIGKGGNYIKQIKEGSGAYVQISQKPKDQNLNESSGNMGSNYSPNSSSVGSYGSPGCSPISAGVNFNLATLMAAGNGTFNPPQFIENMKSLLRTNGYSDQATIEIVSAMNTLASYGLLGLGLGLNSMMPINSNHPNNLGNLGINVGNSLVNGMFGSSSGTGSGSAPTAMDTTPPGPVPSGNGIVANNGVFGPIGSIAGGSPNMGMGSPTTPRPTDHVPDSFDPFRRNSPSLGPSSNLHVINNNSFGLGTNASVMSGLRKSPTQVDKPLPNQPGSMVVQQPFESSKQDMEVGENIVGAILGPGGKSLVEIQHFSGANIQISKKGVFAPGTRNRIVTITGTPTAVSTAHYLIEQRIADEEAKRARQNMLGVSR